MKLHCPTCDRKLDIGGASRYETFTCPCGRNFRGIHAKEGLLDVVIEKLVFPFHLLTAGIFFKGPTLLNQTPCPFCHARIKVSTNPEYKGVVGPEYCWACTKKLPTEPVNNMVKWDGSKWVPRA